jgi:hypothetical protein
MQAGCDAVGFVHLIKRVIYASLPAWVAVVSKLRMHNGNEVDPKFRE